MRPHQLLLALLLAVLAGALGAQSVYYFDQDGGNDGNPGTEASPKASIAWLNANARQGDICILEAGDTWTTQLRPTFPDVTIQSQGAANGGRATIDVSGATCVWIDQQGILLRDLEITGGTNGIFFDGADVSRFTGINLDIHGQSANGVNSQTLANGATGDGILFLDCLFRDNGVDGIGVRGTIQARVQRGRIYDNADDGGSTHEDSRLDTVGVEITGNEDGLHHTHNTGRSTAERCWIHGNVGGDATSFFPTANVDGEFLVRGSVVVLPASGVTADDSCVEAPSAGKLIVVDSVLQNLNATANNGYCVLLGGAATGTIKNTVMLGANEARAWLTKLDTTGKSEWNRNAYQSGLASIASAFRIGGGGVHTFAEWQVLTGQDGRSLRSPGGFGLLDSTGLEADPLNAAPGARSALIGQGLRTEFSGDVDYRGLLRTGGPWDIGAFAARTYSPDERPPSSTNLLDYYDQTRQSVSLAWAIGTTPTYLDLTRHLGTIEERVAGGGTRLRVTSASAGAVKFRVGYELRPAADPAALSVFETGVSVFAFNGQNGWEFRCSPDRRITSLCAIASVPLTGVSVTLDL